MFKAVVQNVDFVEIEKKLLAWWYESGIVKKYLSKNSQSKSKFSFLDGPITANNPMAVHHAWGRTYKDLWQKYHTMKGDAGRYQNGFDCQGLWIEVEVEKELGFKSKKDIETYGVANFVNKCKERVMKYSTIQTEQTKRLGNFMDWDNSYFTMSDENNYAIWKFLKICHENGWLYKGHESIPWCPRCETAISQHEILTETYKETVHESVYLKLPIIGREKEFLLIWTTTPWTIPANIAVAVDEKMEYSLIDDMWIASGAVERLFGKVNPSKKCLGKELVGLKYKGPFDDLPAVQEAASDPKFHTVIATDNQIMPITTEEGTGLVHTAVSAGEEDFKLGKKLGLPMIPVIADNADYFNTMGFLSGKNAKKHPELILDYLKSEHWALRTEHYKHRYPGCWRCGTELVWKVADEWYIAMDRVDDSQKTLREQMVEVTKKIHWLPEFGLDRELDWLKNMHDWLISKKNRYWGLALPIYECLKCGNFEVIGGREELKSRAVEGFDKFDGNSPHKPWIDEIKIKCNKCNSVTSRINDVGNVWLDAGIVPISTLPEDWFPAHFITESFPGQFKNWFYSMIVMSTVLKKTNPFNTVLGYATVLAEDGRPMHKSWGNYIEFNEGADKIGVDVLRWMYAKQQPADNILFGYKKADETRRQFHLMFWNVYNFFVTYANLDGFQPSNPKSQIPSSNILDQWILIRLNQTIEHVTLALDKFDAFTASHTIEDLVNDMSLWYVRRSRDRVGPTASDLKDKMVCHSTLYTLLTTLTQLMAPFMPYMPEEIYKNLTGDESVHLSEWPSFVPLSGTTEVQAKLIEDMKLVRKIVEMGLSERKKANIKVRQPLRALRVNSQLPISNVQLIQLVKDELNVKEVTINEGKELAVELDTTLDEELLAEGKLRELMRQIQDKRKELGARLDQKIILTLPDIPKNQTELMRQVLAEQIIAGAEFGVQLV